MDSIKPNPFLSEVESLLKALGLDVDQAKRVAPNAVLFNFNFNEIPVYLCVPNALPNRYSNVSRIEAEIADLEEVETAQLTVIIASYLHIEDCTPIRVVTKRSKGTRVKLLIEFVSNLQMLQTGALAVVLLHCCELADQLRSELILEQKSSVA